MKLGIVLATTDDLLHAHSIALAARRARHEVVMFLMDAGCSAIALHPELAASLIAADIEITACSNSSVGLTFVDGIVRGSQDDHAALIATSQRVVALT